MELIFAAFLGLIAGNLVNYFSDVLPIHRKLARPECASCHANYNWKDYLLILPCKSCGKSRSLRTLITLVAGSGIAISLWLNPPALMGFWLGLLLITYFGIIVVIDFEHRLILHMVSLAGVVLGLIIGTVEVGIVRSLIGGLVGGGIMLLFYWMGTFFARMRARKLGHDDGEEALGFGDVTISVVIGLMLGWPLVMYGLFLGILAGGLVSLVLVLALVSLRRYESMTLFTAYGPYLVIGAAILLYFPKTLSILLGK